jgi:hypothetical protein
MSRWMDRRRICFARGWHCTTRLALEHGASAQEINRCVAAATAQGLDGSNLGVGILVEELAAAGLDTFTGEVSGQQQALREAYVARFGDFPDFCDQWLRLDPGYFAVLLDLLAGGRGQAGSMRRQVA